MKPWNKEEFAQRHPKYGFTYNKGRWLQSRWRKWIGKWMEAKGCSQCGYSNPLALELDHRTPADKSFAVFDNNHTNLRSKQRHKVVTNEIRKCDILCANCHKIKTKTMKDTARNLIAKDYQQWRDNK